MLTSISNFGVVFIRKGHDFIMNGSCFASLVDFLIGGRKTCISDVVHDSVIKEHRVLWNDANTGTKTLKRYISKILYDNGGVSLQTLEIWMSEKAGAGIVSLKIYEN